MIADVDVRPIEELNEAAEVQTNQSYLVAECGHCNTSVILFEKVSGQYRMIARGSSLTTAGSPWFDATLGVKQAIKQISMATGRIFFDHQGTLIRPARSDGSGVDEFGLTMSLGDSQKVLIAGLLDEISVASAQKLIFPLNAHVVDTFSLSDMRNRPAQVMAIMEHRPDIILLTGGTDGGADRRLIQLVYTLTIGIELLDRSERPVVVFAGNAALRSKVDDILGEFTEVFRAENIRPKYDEENLDHATNLMTELVLVQNINAISGLSLLREWSGPDVRRSDHAFVGIGEYFAARTRGQVFCLDVGSSHVTLALASPEETNFMVRPELGVGHGSAELLKKEDLAVIKGWAGDELDFDDIRTRISNKVYQPNVIPFDNLDQNIDLGIVQAAIQRAMTEGADALKLPPSGRLPDLDLLLIRGRVLTSAPDIGKALLAILNSLQPTGIFRVIADVESIMPALGLLAATDPRLVIEIIDSGVLDNWGWVIVPEGISRNEKTVLKVSLKLGSGETKELEIQSGNLELLSPRKDGVTEISLNPASNIDVGNGKGKSRKLRLAGGRLGIVVDARGRPLPEAKNDEEYQHMIQKSLKEIGV